MPKKDTELAELLLAAPAELYHRIGETRMLLWELTGRHTSVRAVVCPTGVTVSIFQGDLRFGGEGDWVPIEAYEDSDLRNSFHVKWEALEAARLQQEESERLALIEKAKDTLRALQSKEK